MYVYIIRAGDSYTAGLVDRPVQFIRRYREGKVVGSAPYVCSMANFVFLWRYPHHTRRKLQRLIDQLVPSTLEYYAKQPSHTLVRWFNKAADLSPPHAFELDLIDGDVFNSITRCNRGIYLVKGGEL